LVVVSKYNAPSTKASPSLSSVGPDDLTPRYLSSNESYEAAALVSLTAAAVSLAAAADSEAAALVSLTAAAAAELSIAIVSPALPS
jgi:hypothetical protein